MNTLSDGHQQPGSGADDALMLRRRLDDMNRRWHGLRAKTVAIRYVRRRDCHHKKSGGLHARVYITKEEERKEKKRMRSSAFTSLVAKQESLGEQHGTLERLAPVFTRTHRVGHSKGHGVDRSWAYPGGSVYPRQAAGMCQAVVITFLF